MLMVNVDSLVCHVKELYARVRSSTPRRLGRL